jgi:hypothetical protein
MPKLSYKPKNITKKILSPLQDRSLDVIVNRYGLGKDFERKTLEEIGQKYGITRERVRQIENTALSIIRKSQEFLSEEVSFNELKQVIEELGGIIVEDELLKTLAKDKETQNHIHLHLVLGEPFTKHKEDDQFKSRWTINSKLAELIHSSLENLYSNLSDEELISESEMISRFLDQVKDISEDYKNEELAKRWLSMSKKISKNQLGEWGKSESSNIKTRGIRDFAYLVMRKHGSPMHFKEVAKAITDTFNRKTHMATTHNELIKDSRFVLIGRGIYALTEWGYKPGIVRDVIKEILLKEGPLSKEEVIDRVMKERYLKKNTILVNLQNPKYFKKVENGLYTFV